MGCCTFAFDILSLLLSLWLAKKERHHTLTLEHESVFKKLSFAYLLNSLLVPLGLGLVQLRQDLAEPRSPVPR